MLVGTFARALEKRWLWYSEVTCSVIHAKRALRSAFFVSLAAIATSPRIAVRTNATNPTAITTSTRVKAAEVLRSSALLGSARREKSPRSRIRKPLVSRQDRTGSEATGGVAPFDTTDFKGRYCKSL